MSDAPQGEGWWQASDGKWYPPEQAPGTPQPQAAMPAQGYGQPAPGAAETPGMSQWGPLADWGTRAIAYVIDVAFVIVLGIVGFIISFAFAIVSDVLGALVGLLFYIVYAGAFLYFGFLVGAKGRSPGMAIMGLRCVGEETGQLIGGGTGVIRTIAHIIASIVCYVGWFFPLWDAKRQTLADKVMKTVVLTDQPKETFSVDLFKP